MFYFKIESSSGNHSQKGVVLSKEEWEGSGPGALLARRTRTGFSVWLAGLSGLSGSSG